MSGNRVTRGDAERLADLAWEAFRSETYGAAIELADRAIASALEDVHLEAIVAALYTATCCAIEMGDPKEADRRLDQAFALLGDGSRVRQSLHARLLNVRGIRLMEGGDFEDAFLHFDAAERIYDELEDVDSLIRVKSNSTKALVVQGRHQEAEKRFTELQAIERAEAHDAEVTALEWIAKLRVHAGELEGARAAASEMRRLADMLGMRLAIFDAEMLMARADADEDELALIVRRADADATLGVCRRAEARYHLAEVVARTDRARARQILDDARPMIRSCGQRWLEESARQLEHVLSHAGPIAIGEYTFTLDVRWGFPKLGEALAKLAVFLRHRALAITGGNKAEAARLIGRHKSAFSPSKSARPRGHRQEGGR